MITNEKLIEYLSSKDRREAQQILLDNGMQHMFDIFFDSDTAYRSRQKLAYKLIARKQCSFIQKLSLLFQAAGIDFMIFKGVVLSRLLYGDYEYRQAGDIDIYVYPTDYAQALHLLLDMGFAVREKEGYGEEHHIVLLRKDLMIELHKYVIDPECHIDESYLHNHTMMVDGMKTFDITASFLHLIYHLYTDTFTTTDKYSLYLVLLQPKRFLLREYELVLFAEKYASQIHWDEIIEDIKKQNLRIGFKYMFEDIIRIFPDRLPQEFITVVSSLQYYETEADIDVTRIFAGKFSYEKEYIQRTLSQYMEVHWNPFRDDLQKKLGDSMEIKDNAEDPDTLEKECVCKFSTYKHEQGICLTFEVKDTDFSFADYTFPDVHKSDGIQLFMCGTERYSYQNIFLFPRANHGNYEVTPYNVIKRKLIKRDFIDATIEVFDFSYKITICLTDKFLAENQIKEVFYLNVVVCDCDSNTHKRKNTYNLIRQGESWYNPIYFVRIDCRNC